MWCVFGANLPRQGRKDRNIGTRLAIGISVLAKKASERSISGGLFYLPRLWRKQFQSSTTEEKETFFSASKDGIGANSVRLKLNENQGKKD